MSNSTFNITDLITCQLNLSSVTTLLTTCETDIISFQQNQTDMMGQLDNCTTALAAALAGTDGGDGGDTAEIYNKGLHIAAVFIILAASTLGTVLPLLSRYHEKLSVDPYYIILGKCSGIGIILACALVHMIQPANESLTDASLGFEFSQDYPAYAFLYALLGALGMHFLDFVLEYFITKHLMEHGATSYHREDEIPGNNGNQRGSLELSPSPDKHQDEAKKEMDVDGVQSSMSSQQIVVVTDDSTSTQKQVSTPQANKKKYFENEIHHSHGGHSHGALLLSSQRTLSAWLLEFGVTVHSIFIGLENGVVPESRLKKLLVALCFHQFFEGVALGARIHDARLPSVWQEIWMTLIFAVSAPIGIAIGIGVIDTLEPDGPTYLMTSGTFDGICGGILLYIGFNLLLRDFQEDMKRFVVGHKYAVYRRFGMFAALWTGGGLMAYIGKYL